MIDAEEWRPVVGREGWYEVSNHGRVRSVPRSKVRAPTALFPNGVRVRWKGKVLRPGVMKSGHLFIMLGRNDGALVHRLVLEAFVGPCPDGCESLHRNDVPGDNNLSNLRWGTRAENIEDAFQNGGRRRSQNPDPRNGTRKKRKSNG